jgi:hypothetical protein
MLLRVVVALSMYLEDPGLSPLFRLWVALCEISATMTSSRVWRVPCRFFQFFGTKQLSKLASLLTVAV